MSFVGHAIWVLLGFAGVCLVGHVVWVLRPRELFLLGMNGRAQVQQ